VWKDNYVSISTVVFKSIISLLVLSSTSLVESQNSWSTVMPVLPISNATVRGAIEALAVSRRSLSMLGGRDRGEVRLEKLGKSFSPIIAAVTIGRDRSLLLSHPSMLISLSCRVGLCMSLTEKTEQVASP